MTTTLSLHPSRIRILKDGKLTPGPVVYWMGREQRADDNWALIYARDKALELKVPLLVVFCLVPSFLGATLRQYTFMLDGLKEMAERLKALNIPFRLLCGDPDKKIPAYIKEIKASLLVTDFEPLRIKTKWKQSVAKKIAVPFHEVDARNIVPCWVASQKQEFGAYTIRPKLHRLIEQYADTYPRLKRHPYSLKGPCSGVNWKKAEASLEIDKTVGPVDWLKPGVLEAKRVLKKFIRDKLSRYPSDANDPSLACQSGLSPYIHFGHISPLTIYHEIMKCDAQRDAKAAFIEQLFVRRELADNFCFYNSRYDAFDGLPDWSKKTLDKHRKDTRQYVYKLKDLETAKTHDPHWNAAQTEMVKRGKMHGYMRMYWAKKILEWSASPEVALKTAIYLNDKYELDGRDPNGYVGIMWSIGGLHDRPWGERPVFGMVRYMTAGGLKSKFDIEKYVKQVSLL